MRVARRTIVFHLPWLVIALLLGRGQARLAERAIARSARMQSRVKAEGTRNSIEGAMTLTLIAAALPHREALQRLGRCSRTRQRYASCLAIGGAAAFAASRPCASAARRGPRGARATLRTVHCDR